MSRAARTSLREVRGGHDRLDRVFGGRRRRRSHGTDGADRGQHPARDRHRRIEPVEQIGAGVGDARGRRDDDRCRLHGDPCLQLHGRGLERHLLRAGRLLDCADRHIGAGKGHPEVGPHGELGDAVGSEERHRPGPRRREQRGGEHRRGADGCGGATREDTAGEDAAGVDTATGEHPARADAARADATREHAAGADTATREDPAGADAAGDDAADVPGGDVVGVVHARRSLGRRTRRRDRPWSRRVRSCGAASRPTRRRGGRGGLAILRERGIDRGARGRREARTSAARVVAAAARRTRPCTGPVSANKASVPSACHRSLPHPSAGGRSSELGLTQCLVGAPMSPTCRHASATSCSWFSWITCAPSPAVVRRRGSRFSAESHGVSGLRTRNSAACHIP